MMKSRASQEYFQKNLILVAICGRRLYRQICNILIGCIFYGMVQSILFRNYLKFHQL